MSRTKIEKYKIIGSIDEQGKVFHKVVKAKPWWTEFLEKLEALALGFFLGFVSAVVVMAMI